MSVDFYIINFIRENLSCGVMDSLMKFITFLGNGGGVWLCAAIILLFFKKTRRSGLCMLAAIILTHITGNLIIKNIFKRIRPFVAADIPLIINPPGGYSFPSGHTSISFAGASVLSGIYKKYARFFYIMSALIAFSRIYLCVHYPTDILGGIILGTVIGKIVNYVYLKLSSRFREG